MRVEFRLEYETKTLKEMFGVLIDIYNKLLKKDTKWHFFYEGDYILLRCGISYAKRVCVLLNKQKVKYNQKEWEEPFQLTRDFQYVFGPIFHSLSVLVMEIYNRIPITDELIDKSVDRIIHPYLNMATLLQYFKKDSRIRKNWEAETMARLAVFRAFNNGMYEGEFSMRERMLPYLNQEVIDGQNRKEIK